MNRWALLLGTLLLACGGGNQGAESPDGHDDDYLEDPAEDGDVDMGDDLDEGEASSESEQPATDSGGGAVTAEDMQKVLQLVIEDAELGPYLKLEEPGRFPLKISGSAIPSGVELVKNTEPVQVVTGPKDKTDPVLVFTTIDVGPKKGTIKYRYPVESIRGTCIVTKVDGVSELTRSRFTSYQ
jgi:hypothetical protein